MHALIIGATGATGRSLTAQLLADPACTRITAFVRRPSGISHPKFTEETVDFNRPDTWSDKVRGDAAFSCMGTTLKAAGSKEAQFKIDHDYQLAFARAAAENGVSALVLVSAAGADARSRLFYPRMKGELENAVSALPFAKLAILRPPLLVRENSDRPSERWAVAVMNALNRIGILPAQKPMPTAVLARAMRRAAAECRGRQVLAAAEIWQWGDSRFQAA